VRYAEGGRRLERLAGGGGGRRRRRPGIGWTPEPGPNPWRDAQETPDMPALRGRSAGLVREAIQQTLLFPAARLVARPLIHGAADLLHAPQPAIIAPNHSSDLDTPLILAALPRRWRMKTVSAAASDRFYRGRRQAITAVMMANAFPFDRSGELRGLGDAAELIREGWNILLYPQGTRSASIEGFRTGVARLAQATGAPSLPVHVGGTALIMPKDRGITGRGRATVSFGRAINPVSGEEPEALAAALHDAVAALGVDARARAARAGRRSV